MSDLLRVKMTRVPFRHTWPNRSVSVVRELGPVLVGHGRGQMHPDMAEAAIAEGYAQRFNPRGKAATTVRQEIAKAEADAADTRQPDRMDREDHAHDDRPDDQPTNDLAG
jgi:hypothetical protein